MILPSERLLKSEFFDIDSLRLKDNAPKDIRRLYKAYVNSFDDDDNFSELRYYLPTECDVDSNVNLVIIHTLMDILSAYKLFVVDVITTYRIYLKSAESYVIQIVSKDNYDISMSINKTDVIVDRLYIHTDEFDCIKYWFNSVITQSTKAGKKRIILYADRSDINHGYYVWARFGFDAEIPEQQKKLMDVKVNKISDLMKSISGSAWWRKNGFPCTMIFDLDINSQSMQIWNKHKKGIING